MTYKEDLNKIMSEFNIDKLSAEVIWVRRTFDKKAEDADIRRKIRKKNWNHLFNR